MYQVIRTVHLPGISNDCLENQIFLINVFILYCNVIFIPLRL